MKKILALVAVLATAGLAYAAVSPFGPDEEKIINTFKVERTLKVVYEPAVTGGTGSTTYGLKKYLPAGALITQTWVYVDTLATGSGIVQFFCEDDQNIRAYSQYTTGAATTGAAYPGVSTGAATVFGSGIAATCEVSARVLGTALTAGKLSIYIRYITP